MRILSSFPWRRAAALFCACLVCTALWAEAAQGRLADQVIRLHVLANSDSQADQALKLHVRDQVLEETQRLLVPAQDAAGAADLLRANLDGLTQTAQAAVAAWGYDYPVSVRLEETWFPTRQYQGAALPAGDYLALRVLIGAAAGHNWWCVVFPSLCLPAVSETTQPAAALTQENYALITEEDAGYTFRFHLVEWWEGLKHWLAEG